MKRLMIVGGGLQQLPSIRAVRELKWISVVVDKNPFAVGRREADVFHEADISDESRILEIAKKEKEQHGLDGVYTAGTDFSTTVAYVAEALELPCIPYETALNARDKIKMRTILKEIGISVPAYQLISSESCAKAEEDLREFLETHEFPVVIKPTMNMGSRGVRRIDRKRDIPNAVRHAFPYIGDGALLVEEFILGTEYSVDALVYKGKVHIVGFADRHISFAPYFIETGHSIPSSVSSVNFERTMSILEKIADGFSISNGALKGDIFIHEDKVVVGEFAARLSGGFMSGWTIPISSGVYPIHQALRIAAGVPVEVRRTAPVRALYVAEQAFFSIPGTIASIEGLEDILQHKACRHVFLNTPVGTTLPIPKNNTDKVLHFIVASNTRKEVHDLKDHLLNYIKVYLTPSSKKSEEYLFSSPTQLPLLGPELKLSVNIEARKQMPAFYGNPLSNVPVPISPLPLWKDEETHDWSGASISGIVEQALKQKELRIARSGFALGSLFWNALSRGGRQALRYIIDTIRAEGEAAVHRWCDIQQK